MLCPQCKNLSHKLYKPFCSKRCSDLDLHNWFSESYSVEAVELDDIDNLEEELEKLEKELEKKQDNVYFNKKK